MAASAMATMGVVSIVPMKTGLSSSASFGSPLVSVAPLRPVARRNVLIARAALPEEQSGKTARREMLASLMAAGAVIATAGQSFAAVGPGTAAKRTNEKAQDLLKDADELTKNDSPPRFGPGEAGGGDSNNIAQKGGAGAIEDLQGAGGGAVEGAKDAVTKAKEQFGGIFGQKTGDLSDASGAINTAAGKVKSDIDTTKGKVKSDVDTVQGGSFFADAQKKFEESTTGGKNAVGELVDNVKGGLPQ